MRKEAKKGGIKKPAEKLVEIPNKCPFKEELLAEAENKREQIKLEKELRKEARKNGGSTDRAKLNSDIIINAMKNDITNVRLFFVKFLLIFFVLARSISVSYS